MGEVATPAGGRQRTCRSGLGRVSLGRGGPCPSGRSLGGAWRGRTTGTVKRLWNLSRRGPALSWAQNQPTPKQRRLALAAGHTHGEQPPPDLAPFQHLATAPAQARGRHRRGRRRHVVPVIADLNEQVVAVGVCGCAPEANRLEVLQLIRHLAARRHALVVASRLSSGSSSSLLNRH